MKRLTQFVASLAVVVIVAAGARAAYDLTTGTIPDTQQLCWGTKSVCLYGSSGSNYLRVQTNSADVLAINSAGQVGIGTNSPSNALSVTGNANVTGTLSVTGAATFTAPLSSFTVANATGSSTQTTLLACVAQSTVSLVVGTSGVAWVDYSGASSSTVAGSTITVGVLVDGGYATIAGIAETSSLGILRVGNGMAAGLLNIGGNDLNLSFGPLPIKSLSAGSHTFCLAEASTSGTLFPDSAGEISAFTVYTLP